MCRISAFDMANAEFRQMSRTFEAGSGKNMIDQQSKLHQVVFELTKSLSGHSDLKSLCSSLAMALRKAIDFEGLALILVNPRTNCLHAYIGYSQDGTEGEAQVVESWEDGPAGWVWREQKTLVVPNIDKETRWQPFKRHMQEDRVRSFCLLPLSVAGQRFGMLGIGRRMEYVPTAEELKYLERIVSELAVTVNVIVVQEQLFQERDRLRVIHEISNALISKLSIEELFPSISSQLQKIIPHEMASIGLYEKGCRELQHFALHFAGEQMLDMPSSPVPVDGTHLEPVLDEGKVLLLSIEQGFPNLPHTQRMIDAGFTKGCVVPLITPNGIIGALALAQREGQGFSKEETELLREVAAPIAIAVDNSLAYRQLRELKDRLASEKVYLEDEIRLDQNFGNMIGESPSFKAVLHSLQIVAPTDSTVLIEGETGTGKELVARAIHEASSRRQRSFVKINCAAIPSGLLESELFGHEKGAFTGAVAQKIGRFEMANQGTLFMDEIGEVPLELQTKLLRAIQEQEFERLGSNRTIRVNVRIIAATNRNLKAVVEENKFRSDLYYRLHVFPIQVPPLRERKEDIPLLVRFFTQKYAQRMNRSINAIPKKTLQALSEYHWPGNIRELQNVIERSVILTEGHELKVPPGDILRIPAAMNFSLSGRASLFNREQILQALEKCRGIVGGPQGAAARLGMKRTTLQSYMKRLNISRHFQ
jgi:formate hydrogenlyase transcriptional activator